MSSVARPSRSSARATNRLRGLCRLLPLPCANTTRPVAPGGIVRSPGSACRPMGTRTGCVSAFITSDL